MRTEGPSPGDDGRHSRGRPSRSTTSRGTLVGWRELWPWGAALASVLLLLVLAFLQFHWLEQVAEAERHRTEVALSSAASSLADDFNVELSALFRALQRSRNPARGDESDLAEGLARALDQWRERATWPDLVDEIHVLVLGQRPGRGQPEPGSPDSAWSPKRLDRSGQTPILRSSDSTSAALERVIESMNRSARAELGRSGRVDRRDGPPVPGLDFLMAEIPALLVPIPSSTPPHSMDPSPLLRHRARTEDTSSTRRWERRRQEPKHFVIVVALLDRESILETALPALVERHFGSNPPFRIEVLRSSSRGGGPVGEPTGAARMESSGGSKVLFAIGPEAPGAVAEVGAPLFGPLRLDDRRDPRWRRWLGAMAALADLDEGRWRLVVKHPAGSLEAAVERTQRRNLAVVSAILAVLGGALLMLANGYRRSRRLARQQLDFVAGVTHELMTPVAALRSAGQNLADGVVRDPEQVARYGRMIDHEGRRLAHQVGQVLAFARMQASRPRLDLRPLDARGQVEATLAELRPMLESAGVELELELGEELPEVLAEGQALRRCLSNLVMNAIKYGQAGTSADGGSEPWVGLDVVARAEHLRFRVRDRGPGIDPADRPHLFEPFFRGRGMAASAVPGSGLGLALVEHLVEAQGGRVGLESAPGRGTEVWFDLPIAAPAETDSVESVSASTKAGASLVTALVEESK